jgi:hypothetical protein
MRLQAKSTFAAVLALGLSATCPAQQAGFRDLTSFWRAPDDHVPPPLSSVCPNVRSTVSDGELVQATPASAEKLQLTIAEIAPLKLRLGKDFIATVRLKNIGTVKILIPWQPDGERVTHVSADGTEEKYEVADVSFRLTASGKKSIAIPLHSEGALFAQPGDPATYLTIEPGHWVDVKLKANVACGLDNCRSDVQADDHAVLTAWWYQRVLTHQVKNCNEDHGAQTVREVDSTPLPIAVRPAPVSSPGTSHPPAAPENIASGILPVCCRYSRLE